MSRSGAGCLSARCFAALTAALLLLNPAQGAADESLSLGRLLQRVAEASHASRVAALETKRAAQTRREAAASYLPRLELDGGYTVRDSPMVAVFDGFAAPFGTSTFWQYRLGAGVLLWDGGRRRAAVGAAAAAVKATHRNGAASVAEAQLEAVDTYLDAVLAHRRRRVVNRRIEAIQAHLKDAEDLYAQGMVARNDLLEAKVKLRSVRDTLPRLADALELAGRRLARLAGLGDGVVVQVVTDLGPPRPLNTDLESLTAEAAKANPRLRALAARLEAARRAVTRESSGARPRVLLTASHSYEENPYLAYNHVNAATLGVQWELFDGGAREARVTAAELEVRRLQRDLDDARRRVSEALDAGLRALRQARREEATARENVAAAKENLRIVSDQYRAGLARGSDVLDAEALLASSRLARAEHELEIYRRQARILVLAGRDLAAFYGHGAGTKKEENGGS